MPAEQADSALASRYTIYEYAQMLGALGKPGKAEAAADQGVFLCTPNSTAPRIIWILQGPCAHLPHACKCCKLLWVDFYPVDLEKGLSAHSGRAQCCQPAPEMTFG